MKILVLSDLHLEFGVPLTVPVDLEYDVVVLAGDIHNPGTRAVTWAQQQIAFQGRSVVLVPGNHEYYGCLLEAELQQMRNAAMGSNVHVLSKDICIIAGLRFIGCTLWTDFQLKVQLPDGIFSTNVERSIGQANLGMKDFQCIEMLAPARNQYRARQARRLLRAEDTLAKHWIERDWLRRALAEPFDGLTVVVTHHAPSGGSVASTYASSWLTPAYASDLPHMFFDVPTLWIHGHTHTTFDYERDGCRIVTNPRGYSARDGIFENRLFSPARIVNIASRLARDG